MSDPAPPAGLRGPGPRMNTAELSRLRTARYRAHKVLPEPVAKLVGLELSAWELFGFQYGGYGLIKGVIDAILSAPELVPTSRP